MAHNNQVDFFFIFFNLSTLLKTLAIFFPNFLGFIALSESTLNIAHFLLINFK